MLEINCDSICKHCIYYHDNIIEYGKIQNEEIHCSGFVYTDENGREIPISQEEYDDDVQLTSFQASEPMQPEFEEDCPQYINVFEELKKNKEAMRQMLEKEI